MRRLHSAFFFLLANGLIGGAYASSQDEATASRVAVVFAAITPLRKDIEKAIGEKRPFPTGNVSIGSRDVQSVHVSPQGSIDIVFAADLLDGGGRFLMVPFFDPSDRVKWSCLAGIPQKYLPPECRD